MDPIRRRGNSLLDQLEDATIRAIEPHLHPGQLVRGTVLFEVGEPIRHVLFPLSGVVSLSSTTADGGSVEVAAIGAEGLVGGSLAAGCDVTMCRAIVQVEGESVLLDAATFAKVLRGHPDLHAAVFAYLRTLLVQITQSTACNRFHTAEQRLARWLLETADRAGARTFPLTQEFLALMLGMRRPWVTKVIRRLGDRGCIRYRRGEVVVVNRAKLEKSACDCYAIVRQQFARKPFTGRGSASPTSE